MSKDKLAMKKSLEFTYQKYSKPIDFLRAIFQ